MKCYICGERFTDQAVICSIGLNHSDILDEFLCDDCYNVSIDIINKTKIKILGNLTV